MPHREGRTRRLVVCAKCGWRGRRLEDGGPCGREPEGESWTRCAGQAYFGTAHAPKAPVGETRVRMVVRVLERTAQVITPTEAAVLLDAVADAKEAP